jgi:hypothetical protein
MKNRKLMILFIALVLVSYAYAVPNLINFQGKLRNATGSVLSGDYEINFSIYNAATDGDILWSENVSVKANNGLFNVLLGSENPVDLNFTDDYWLSVNVDNDGEMTPRQRISSVGYSFRSGSAENLSGKGDIYLQTDGLNRVVIDSSGNVGIGTVNPGQMLDVAKNVSIWGSLNASNILFVDKSSGNVGIGTTSPSGKLEVVGGDIRLGVDYAYRLIDGGGNAWQALSLPSGILTLGAGADRPVDIKSGAGDAIRFFDGASEAMRIDENGNVGIGQLLRTVV